MSSSKIAVRPEPERIDKPAVVEGESLIDRMRDISHEIARRAYELFEGRGKQSGRDLDDWLDAETDVLRRIPVDLTETDNDVTLRAELPGFNAKDLNVSVEPHRILINGKQSKSDERTEESHVIKECSSKEVFRAINLHTEVDPASADANIKDGILKITVNRIAS